MPRKGENIYKRKDGRWEARYIKCRTANGKAIYGYVYARSYKEVKRKQQQHFMQIETVTNESPTQSSQNSDIFSSLAYEWYQSIVPQVKESTKNKYGNLLDLYIIPRLGSLTIDLLTYEVIEEQANQLLVTGGKNQCGLSPKTVSDILSVMLCILIASGISQIALYHPVVRWGMEGVLILVLMIAAFHFRKQLKQFIVSILKKR